MKRTADTSSTTSDREIVISRVFRAPAQVIWRAWTDPQQVRLWWGPMGFTTTTKQHDLRPGGAWRFTMHGPDGRDYENVITYLEVTEPRLLRYKHGGDRDRGPTNFEVTIRFEDDGPGQTRVTMRSVFASPEARDFVVREYNAIEGGKQTLSRLADHIEPKAGARAIAPFTTARVFTAPRELVWDAWTRREHLQQWFGPKGTVIPSCTLDLRVGGRFHYGMRTPEGMMMWGLWIFREITRPERLVFELSFSDEKGEIVRAPFDQAWPLRMLTTISFAEHAGIGRGTVVTVAKEASEASDSERATFDAGHPGMQQGWAGTFDKLAEFLAARAGNKNTPSR